MGCGAWGPGSQERDMWPAMEADISRAGSQHMERINGRDGGQGSDYPVTSSTKATQMSMVHFTLIKIYGKDNTVGIVE